MTTHSRLDSVETAFRVVFKARIRLGEHEYTSNWAVANCRCDVRRGMPWHRETAPVTEYKVRYVSVSGNKLPMLDPASSTQVRVSNIWVKQFRSLLRRKGNRNDFVVCQLMGKGKQEYAEQKAVGR